MEKDPILLVNFGGPRNLSEVYPFLKTLLLDRDVIQSGLPSWIHRLIFGRIAKKRAGKISHDYALIGGKSPIYEDTEALALAVSSTLQRKVVTFHRYLPETHKRTISLLQSMEANRWIVIPMFPQFSYATTGSTARFLSEKLCNRINRKLHWIRSYATHPLYIEAMKRRIDDFLKENNLHEEEIALLFSAHGLPQKFICHGDPYERECEATFLALQRFYPHALCKLSYQSKFGPGEWIRPYTDEMCENVSQWTEGRKTICIIPLSFTSDHIETLYEIEELYVKKIINLGYHALRVPALGLREDWIRALSSIIATSYGFATSWMLVRPSLQTYGPYGGQHLRTETDSRRGL